jgi:hypothetical protein
MFYVESIAARNADELARKVTKRINRAQDKRPDIEIKTSYVSSGRQHYCYLEFSDMETDWGDPLQQE